MIAVGWWRLPHSGQPFCGPVPNGRPSFETLEQLLASGNRSDTVGHASTPATQPPERTQAREGTS
jgi:hypothetical protein